MDDRPSERYQYSRISEVTKRKVHTFKQSSSSKSQELEIKIIYSDDPFSDVEVEQPVVTLGKSSSFAWQGELFNSKQKSLRSSQQI
jgi:hypothetical protein